MKGSGILKLKYYGTAAAEGFPGIFCECEACRKAKMLGGKNIRTRSQSTVDDVLLLDFCPDTYMHILHGGLDLSRIEALLVTHSHFDHLHPETLKCLSRGMSKRNSNKFFEVYSAQSGYEKICDTCADIIDGKGKTLDVHLVQPFESFEVQGYRIIALPASHASSASPLNYIVSKDGKALLYAHDTGLFADEVYDFLEKSGIYIGLVSIDCTYGTKKTDNLGHHLSFFADVEIAEKLKELGVCNEKTIFVANHFSHNCGSTYHELCTATKGSGFIISYDGLEIEI